MREQSDRVADAYARYTESEIAQFLEMNPQADPARAESELREIVVVAANRARQLECERAARTEPTQWHAGAPCGAEGLYLVELVPDWVPDWVPPHPEGWPVAPWQVLVQWYGHKGRCTVTDTLVYDHHILRHRWLSE